MQNSNVTSPRTRSLPLCPTDLVDSLAFAHEKCPTQVCCTGCTEGVCLQLQHARSPGKAAFLSQWRFSANVLAGWDLMAVGGRRAGYSVWGEGTKQTQALGHLVAYGSLFSYPHAESTSEFWFL